MKKRKKYGTGTAVTNYMENPFVVLQQDQIDKTKAQHEAGSNPLTQGLNLAGNLIMQYGLSQGGFGASGAGQAANTALPMLANMQFAGGGTVPGVPVEVEGKEVAETPNGNLLEFKGADHEQGGVDANLPKGTEIYSKRIKVKGKTMADRKKSRENKELSLKKLLGKNPTDQLTKNSMQRTQQTNAIQEQFDQNVQNVISDMMSAVQQFSYGGDVNQYAAGGVVGDKKDKFPGGGTVGDPFDFTLYDVSQYADPMDANAYTGDFTGVPSLQQGNDDIGAKLRDFLGDFNDPTTLGDKVGLVGNAVSTIAPYLNTLKNRAGDTPNINAYESYGQEGLQALEGSKDLVTQVRDQSLADLELSKNAGIRRGRNSARGVNTQRALDLATQLQANEQQSKIYSGYAGQLMELMNQEANLLNQQDQMVMSGEQARDLADRQDRDNFYTQLGQDKVNIGTGLQETGKDLNAIKQNQVIQNLLGELSKYGITVDDLGQLTTK